MEISRKFFVVVMLMFKIIVVVLGNFCHHESKHKILVKYSFMP